MVFNADRTQVLLQLREDIRAWGLPSGGMEPDELPERAAIRETREETGCEIELVRKVGEYWRPQMPGGGVLFHLFEGRVIGGDVAKHDWESIEVKWFPVHTLPKPLTPFAKQMLEDAHAQTSEQMKRTQTLPLLARLLFAAFLLARRIRHKTLRRLALDGLRQVGLFLRWSD